MLLFRPTTTAYLGEERCITFEDCTLFSERVNRPFDFQQYNRNIIQGNDFESVKNSIRNEITKVVDKNPKLMKTGLLDETRYDIDLSNKLFKELKIEEVIDLIESSVSQRRHGLGYGSRIEEVIQFLNGVNKFFDDDIEACRLQIAASLSKLRDWEIVNFFSDPRKGCSDVIIDPPNPLYYGGDYKEAQKDYYDKIENYNELFIDLATRVRNLKEMIREKLHVVF